MVSLAPFDYLHGKYKKLVLFGLMHIQMYQL